MKTKIFYISVVVAFITICAILYFSKSPASEQIAYQKCPEDYAENDIGTAEYRDALIDWTSEFFETHPRATVSDWAMVKYQLWVDNNCVVAMQRSKMSGIVTDLKPWEKVDYVVQQSIQSATDNQAQ